MGSRKETNMEPAAGVTPSTGAGDLRRMQAAPAFQRLQRFLRCCGPETLGATADGL